MSKLSNLKVSKNTKPGLLGDGNGLYLQTSKSGSKSWLFRFMMDGKAQAMGLGSVDSVALLEARAKAIDCRKQISLGANPLSSKREALQKMSTAKMTFAEAASQYIDSQKVRWSNPKHVTQWENTLKTYAYPVCGNLAVALITVENILDALTPIWSTKTETASRVRNRIEIVLDWATAKGFRSGPNPAVWRGHLDKLLPRRSHVSAVRHHEALPFDQVAEFVTKLHEQPGSAARALEFTILTAVRTSEALNASWDEINFSESLWTIPASRMKARKEHRVPLSPRCLQILTEMIIEGGSGFIFKGMKANKPLSNMTMLKTLERMKVGVTVHGFRSTFRDWLSECTNYPNAICEQALAHTIDNKVESAYRRGDMLRKRRALMDDWADYCLGRTQVSPIANREITSLQESPRDLSQFAETLASRNR